jgi:hypothetical protein
MGENRFACLFERKEGIKRALIAGDRTRSDPSMRLS